MSRFWQIEYGKDKKLQQIVQKETQKSCLILKHVIIKIH